MMVAGGILRVAALGLGLATLAVVAGFRPAEPDPSAAPEPLVETAGCSSCDARHQRIGQQRLSLAEEQP
jgi:hypothetical protein